MYRWVDLTWFDQRDLADNHVHEEVHLSFSSPFQYSFETIEACFVNIILRQLVPSIYDSYVYIVQGQGRVTMGNSAVTTVNVFRCCGHVIWRWIVKTRLTNVAALVFQVFAFFY